MKGLGFQGIRFLRKGLQLIRENELLEMMWNTIQKLFAADSK